MFTGPSSTVLAQLYKCTSTCTSKQRKCLGECVSVQVLVQSASVQMLAQVRDCASDEVLAQVRKLL